MYLSPHGTSISVQSQKRYLLHLCKCLRNGRGSLLLCNHHLEAAKIRKSSTLALVGDLGSPSSCVPLSLDTLRLPCLDQELLSAVLAQTSHHNIRQCNSLQKDELSVHTGGSLRTVNQDSLGVKNVNDGGELASIRAIIDKDDTSSFYKSSESHCIYI